MRSRGKPGRDQAHLVTEAQLPRSAEIRQRERRYLLIMGIRLACFVLAGVLLFNHAGWLAVIPLAGSIGLPYIAVIIANTRRQGAAGEFRTYQPRLPDRYSPPAGTAGSHGTSADGRPGEGGAADGAGPGEDARS